MSNWIDLVKVLNVRKVVFDEDSSLCCPITLEIFKEPVVVLGSGQTYEKSAILRHLENNSTDPLTKIELTQEMRVLIPNVHVKRMVGQFRDEKARECNEHLSMFQRMEFKAGSKLTEESTKLVLDLITRANYIQPENSVSKENSIKSYQKLMKWSTKKLAKEMDSGYEECFKKTYNELILRKKLGVAMKMLKERSDFLEDKKLINLYLLIQEYRSDDHPDLELRMKLLKMLNHKTVRNDTFFKNCIGEKEMAKFWWGKFALEEHTIKSLDHLRRKCWKGEIESNVFTVKMLERQLGFYYRKKMFGMCFDYLTNGVLEVGPQNSYWTYRFRGCNTYVFYSPEIRYLRERYRKIFLKKGEVDFFLKLSKIMIGNHSREKRYECEVKLLEEVEKHITDPNEHEKIKEQLNKARINFAIQGAKKEMREEYEKKFEEMRKKVESLEKFVMENVGEKIVLEEEEEEEEPKKKKERKKKKKKKKEKEVKKKFPEVITLHDLLLPDDD